jgi:cytochrome c5
MDFCLRFQGVRWMAPRRFQPEYSGRAGVLIGSRRRSQELVQELFMIQNRGILVAVVLSTFAALLLIPAGSVEASTKPDPASVARRVFNERNLPSQGDLALLQAGAAGTPQASPLPEGKGKDLTQQKCNMCHTSSKWDKKHYTQDQWASVMDQMLEKGMQASDEQIATMTSYLAANFGPVKKDDPAPPPPPQ